MATPSREGVYHTRGTRMYQGKAAGMQQRTNTEMKKRDNPKNNSGDRVGSSAVRWDTHTQQQQQNTTCTC